MYSSRENKKPILICIVLVIAGGLLHLVNTQWHPVSLNTPVTLLYVTALFIWIIQVKRRLLDPAVVRLMVASALLMTFWLMLRNIKYEFVGGEWLPGRMIWYMYYIPMLFVPLLMFLSSLHIGKADTGISRKWQLIMIPAAVICILILTNEYHEMAFGIDMNEATGYLTVTHRAVYFAAVIWIGAIMIATLAVTFAKCTFSVHRRKIWIPLAVLAVLAVYSALDIFGSSTLLHDIYKMPEMFCIAFCAFWESLIRIRLYPSNDGYDDFWKASSIGAGLMDEEGRIYCSAEDSSAVTPEQVRRAQTEIVLTEDGKMELKSSRVQGGYAYWMRDVSDIDRLNRVLAEEGDHLEDENAILRAENELEEECNGIIEKNRIYEKIGKMISPQLDRIERLLDIVENDSEKADGAVKAVCFTGAYIKRISALLLDSEKTDTVDSEKLHLAFLESAETLRLFGIDCSIAFKGKAALPSSTVIFAYEYFEHIMSDMLASIEKVSLTVNISDDDFEFCMVPGNGPQRFSVAAVLGGEAE
ncbi:MAG: histidine kinase N-terminal 7TM domain-containing protein [Eubacteriaceae bacterium]|nr:histidine kinase N-terminal 7TM domain-containing protein [Eubacteriaceae bacterium]